MVTMPPKIIDFVLYAERGVSLGDHATAFRGDIGGIQEPNRASEFS